MSGVEPMYLGVAEPGILSPLELKYTVHCTTLYTIFLMSFDIQLGGLIKFRENSDVRGICAHSTLPDSHIPVF